MRTAALQLYRLAILAAIACLLRHHQIALRVGGDAPITLSEIREIYPTAARLRLDPGERAGVFVTDAGSKLLGYALRTMPQVERIIGYRGWTDALIAFDPALRVLGVRVRSSLDTTDHVADVRGDRYFMKTWNGKPWDEVARTTPEQAGIEGVSGATLTSMAIADGIMRRLASADAALAVPPVPFRLPLTDVGLGVIIAMGGVLAASGTYGRPWLRRGFQVLVIGYIGFFTGTLLAQSLIAGWTLNGIPWGTAPGLVLLLAAALAVPWVTGKALYCQQLCPHGAAQELLHRVAPKRWRLVLPRDVDRGLRWLPGLLLAVVLATCIMVLPLDLAHIEPFDAYVLRSAGWATAAIALGGLIASLFVPMAYCHYGCPTGALLNFVRRHGRADRFGFGDASALALLVFAGVLVWNYHTILHWIMSDV